MNQLDPYTLRVVERWLRMRALPWRQRAKRGQSLIAVNGGTAEITMQFIVFDHLRFAASRRARMRKCEECKWYQSVPYEFDLVDVCQHAGNETHYVRANGGKCGPEGKLWEDKQ